jgi:hypothetical protein
MCVYAPALPTEWIIFQNLFTYIFPLCKILHNQTNKIIFTSDRARDPLDTFDLVMLS